MAKHIGNLLVGYLDGALSPDVARCVERHLAACATCRSDLDALLAARAALPPAGREISARPFDPALWSRVESRIAVAPTRPLLRWAWAGGAGALATTALCIALVVNRPIPHPRVVLDAPAPGGYSGAADASRMSATSAPGARRDARPHPKPGFRPVPQALERAEERPTPPPAHREPSPPPRPALARAGTAEEPPAGLLSAGADTPFGAPPPAALRTDARFTETPVAAPPPPPAPALKAEAPAAPEPEVGSSAHPGSPYEAAVGEPLLAKGVPVENLGVRALPRAGAPSMKAAERAAPTVERMAEPTSEGRRLFAEALRATGRGNAEAASLYREALEAGLPPFEARVAHIRLGDVAVQEKDDAAAVEHYTAAALIAKDAPLMVKVGAALERLKDDVGAINAYEQALILDGGNTAARAALRRLKKT